MLKQKPKALKKKWNVCRWVCFCHMFQQRCG